MWCRPIHQISPAVLCWNKSQLRASLLALAPAIRSKEIVKAPEVPLGEKEENVAGLPQDRCRKCSIVSLLSTPAVARLLLVIHQAKARRRTRELMRMRETLFRPRTNLLAPSKTTNKAHGTQRLLSAPVYQYHSRAAGPHLRRTSARAFGRISVGNFAVRTRIWQ